MLSTMSVKRLLRFLFRTLTSPAYRPTTFDQAEWDRQYREGRWKQLGSVREAARFGVIAAWCSNFVGNRSVLDIGCGVGTLRSLLPGCERYVGVDLSLEAIAAARKSDWPGARFEVADATGFVPSEEVTIIVFNEVLYYLPDPLATVERYLEWLAPDGIFIVSMYQQYDPGRIWKQLDARFEALHSVAVEDASGLRWHLRAYPARPADNRRPETLPS